MPARGERGPDRPRRMTRPSALAAGITAGGLALILFAATCARGLEWQDSGFHQYRILTGQLEHPLGLALAHPLHWWLGRGMLALPLGDPAVRINLLSSISGATAVGALAALVVLLTRSRWAAYLAGATLALAHSFWQMSATTETYTLAAAMMTVEWLLLWRFARGGRPAWLVAVFFVNGLHVADHMLGTLTLATYGVLLLERVVRGRVGAKWLPACAVAWLVGATPYLVLVADFYHQTGDLARTLRSALFGGGVGTTGWAAAVLNVEVGARQLLMAALVLGYCFPSLALPTAAAGLLRRTRGRGRLLAWVLTAQTLVVTAFVVRYNIKDVYTYFVPVCVLVALWAGVGVRALRPSTRRWISRPALHRVLALGAALPIVVYLAFPPIAQRQGWLASQMRPLPFRNAYTHFLRPWRHLDDSAERMARAALEDAGPGGWIIADSNPAPLIAAAATLRGAPDGVRVFFTLTRACLFPLGGELLSEEMLAAHLGRGGRVIAVASREVESLVPPGVEIIRSEPFWQLLARPATSEAGQRPE